MDFSLMDAGLRHVFLSMELKSKESSLPEIHFQVKLTAD